MPGSLLTHAWDLQTPQGLQTRAVGSAKPAEKKMIKIK